MDAPALGWGLGAAGAQLRPLISKQTFELGWRSLITAQYMLRAAVVIGCPPSTQYACVCGAEGGGAPLVRVLQPPLPPRLTVGCMCACFCQEREEEACMSKLRATAIATTPANLPPPKFRAVA